MYNICLYNRMPGKFYYEKAFLNDELRIRTTYDSGALTEKKEAGKIEEIQSNEGSNYIIRTTRDAPLKIEVFLDGKRIIPNNSKLEDNIVNYDTSSQDAIMEGKKVNDDTLSQDAIMEEHVAKDSCSSLGLIEEIYNFCYKSAYMYSWNHYICNMCLKPYSPLIYSTEENYNKIKEAFYEIEYLIKEQCLLVTLYTVQYLLNDEHTISADALSDIKYMGYDYYNNHSTQVIDKMDKGYTSYEKINSVLTEVEISRINVQFESYLGEVLDEMLDGAFSDYYMNRKGNERLLPLFLSNFIFKAIDNYDKLNTDRLLNEIKNSKVSNINRKKEAFVNNYVNCMNDFICYPEKSSLLDKILFYYQKDQVFNCDLIISCFIGDNNNLPLIKNTKIEFVKECMTLQNISFKTELIKLFDYFEDNEDYFINTPSEMIKMLSNVIIPTFERTFFITLFDYIKENFKLTDKGTLEKMDEEIKNIIGIPKTPITSMNTLKKMDREVNSLIGMYKTPITSRIINDKIIDFNKDIKYSNKTTEIKQNDRMYILYEILECFFKERKRYNKTYYVEDPYYYSAKKFMFELANKYLKGNDNS